MAEIQSLIGRIVGRQTARREAGLASYREAVASIVAGHDPADDDAVEQMLSAAGKSIEDFKKDVALGSQRRQWRRMIEKEPALIQKRDALKAQRADVERVTNEQLEKGRRQLAEIETEQISVHKQMTEVAEARAQLAATAAAPPDLKIFRQELSAAVGRLQEIEKEEVHAEGRVRNITNRPDETEAARAALSIIIRRKETTERQISELRSRIATVEESLLCQ